MYFYHHNTMVLFCFCFVLKWLVQYKKPLGLNIVQKDILDFYIVLSWISNLTAPDIKIHTAIWEGSIGNCLEKGKHFGKILCRWVDKPSVTVHRRLSSTNQINKPQTLWPAEPVGKSNVYWSLSEEKPWASFFAFLSLKKYSPAVLEPMLSQYLL